MQNSGGNIVYENVVLGRRARLLAPCIVGSPPAGCRDGELVTRIGDGTVVRPFTTIYAGAVLGYGVQTGHGALIREDNEIGDGASIGTNAVLEPGNRVGARTRIHTGCFLESVTLGDDVFVGPNVVFTDDPHPPCPRYRDCRGGATVEAGASIGANSTIVPGVTIGRGALVGAGSVVTKDVPPGTVVRGNPARAVGEVADLECASGFFDRPYAWEARSGWDPGRRP